MKLRAKKLKEIKAVKTSVLAGRDIRFTRGGCGGISDSNHDLFLNKNTKTLYFMLVKEL